MVDDALFLVSFPGDLKEIITNSSAEEDMRIADAEHRWIVQKALLERLDVLTQVIGFVNDNDLFLFGMQVLLLDKVHLLTDNERPDDKDGGDDELKSDQEVPRPRALRCVHPSDSESSNGFELGEDEGGVYAGQQTNNEYETQPSKNDTRITKVWEMKLLAHELIRCRQGQS